MRFLVMFIILCFGCSRGLITEGISSEFECGINVDDEDSAMACFLDFEEWSGMPVNFSGYSVIKHCTLKGCTFSLIDSEGFGTSYFIDKGILYSDHG